MKAEIPARVIPTFHPRSIAMTATAIAALNEKGNAPQVMIAPRIPFRLPIMCSAMGATMSYHKFEGSQTGIAGTTAPLDPCNPPLL